MNAVEQFATILLEKAHARAAAGGRGILLDKLFAAAGVAQVVDDVAVHVLPRGFDVDGTGERLLARAALGPHECVRLIELLEEIDLGGGER